MKRPIVIVFGLSGVGKTTFCNKIKEINPSYIHYQASALLKEATGLRSEQLRIESKHKIESNQSLLARIFRSKRDSERHKPIVVDAHSIIDNDRDLVVVPIETVRALEPTLLVFLEEDPEILVARRRHGDRYRPERSVPELRSQQQLAKEVVLDYAKNLRVPVTVLRPSIVEATGARNFDPSELLKHIHT